MKRITTTLIAIASSIKNIVANEFEPIIADLKNMIQSLEQRYLAAKDVFNYRMNKEMENFENPYTTIATGM